MSDFDDGMVIGLAIGKKKFKGGGSTEKKWEYPTEWLPLPTPAENEVCFLIMLNKDKFEGGELKLHSRFNNQSGDGVVIDWGDGIVEDIDWNAGQGVNPKHIYTAGKGTPLSDNVEMYIIKAAYRGSVKFDEISEAAGQSVLAAAINVSAMSTNDQNPSGCCFNYPRSLRYIKLTGDPTPWEVRCSSGFVSTNSLVRVDFDFTRKVTGLPKYTFQQCESLTSANLPDLSEVKELGESCLNYCPCLTELSLPKLETAGNSCFSSDYNLRKLELPKLKLIGSESSPSYSTFYGLYCLRELSLPSLENIYNSNYGTIFSDCYSLEQLDMPKLASMPVQARNIGGSSRSLRHLNVPNVDTTGWFPDSICIQ